MLISTIKNSQPTKTDVGLREVTKQRKGPEAHLFISFLVIQTPHTQDLG
jgi:hypothetical protein